MDLLGLQAELERICLALQDEKIDTLEVIHRVTMDMEGSLMFYAGHDRDASDISRVLLPSMASMMSPLWICALSAGPPGITETTAA